MEVSLAQVSHSVLDTVDGRVGRAEKVMKAIGFRLKGEYSETKSSIRIGHSWQPVIPGKAAGRDPESRGGKLDSRSPRGPGTSCAGITARAASLVSAAVLSARAMDNSQS